MTRKTPLFFKVSAGFAAIVPALALVILVEQWFGGTYSARLASLNPGLFGEPTVHILSVETVDRPGGESSLVTVRVENPTWRRMDCYVIRDRLRPLLTHVGHETHLRISDPWCGLSELILVPRFGSIDVQIRCPPDAVQWRASAIFQEADYRMKTIESDLFAPAQGPGPRRVAVR